MVPMDGGHYLLSILWCTWCFNILGAWGTAISRCMHKDWLTALTLTLNSRPLQQMPLWVRSVVSMQYTYFTTKYLNVVKYLHFWISYTTIASFRKDVEQAYTLTRLYCERNPVVQVMQTGLEHLVHLLGGEGLPLNFYLHQKLKLSSGERTCAGDRVHLCCLPGMRQDTTTLWQSRLPCKLKLCTLCAQI